MWLWIIIVLALLAVLLYGVRRVNTGRVVGPEEGLEDQQITRDYDKISRWPQFRLIRKLIIHEIRRLRPESNIVDIGCGPGYLIADILKAFPGMSGVGVDISEEMLRRGRENLARLGLADRAEFRQGDIQSLPFEDDSLDFVVSTLSMHHWSEPEKALNEMYRVLKPGNWFLMFDLRRDSPRLFYWILKFAQAFILPRGMGRMNEPTSSALAGYTPGELEAMIQRTPVGDYRVILGIFWVFLTGRKAPAA